MNKYESQPRVFNNRTQAGAILGLRLQEYKDKKAIVLSLPKSGMKVGFEVAAELDAPLEVIVSRPLRVPHNKNLLIGAIATGNTLVVDRSIQHALLLSDDEVNDIITSEMKALQEEMIQYNSGSHTVREKELDIAILVDDGFADGFTIKAALESAKTLYNPKVVIFASPVCAKDVLSIIEDTADHVVFINSPEHLFSINNWYEQLEKMAPQEIIRQLQYSYNMHRNFATV